MAQSWVFKALMALLVLSFVSWGATRRGGMFTSGGVKLGSADVSIEHYNAIFNRELQGMSRQFGRKLTPDEGRKIGIDQRVIEQLMVERHARELNLGVSDDLLIERIHNLPGMKKPDGSFNSVRFGEALRENGFSESGFIAYQKDATIRSQLTSTIAAPAPVSKILIDAGNIYQNQTRSLKYFVVTEEKLPKAVEPDEAKLKAYYIANADRFFAPEMRKIGVLSANPDSLKSTIDVSDTDLKAEYQARIAQYGTPEKRTLQQLSFQDKAKAAAAFKDMSAGKDFLAVAKAAGFSEKDVNLGAYAKADMIDKKVAEKAFALEKGRFSEPVDGDFSTSIVRVVDIAPATLKTFDQVKAELKDQVQRERALVSITAAKGVQDTIEDQRAKGKSLTEIAKELNLPYREVGPFTKALKTADGTLITDVPGLDQLARVAATVETGVEVDPVDLGQNGTDWIEVREIVPKRQKPFEEVKAEVKTALIASDRKAALAKFAGDLTDRANKGETLEAIAKSLGVSVMNVKDMKRSGADGPIGPALLGLAFALQKDTVSTASSATSEARIVFQVASITDPKPVDAAKLKAEAENLGGQIGGEALEQYISSLETHYGIDPAQTAAMAAGGMANTGNGGDDGGGDY